jgi:hypothetical protein
MVNVITPSDRERPAHTTNGSSRRTARSVSAHGMIFRVASEIQSLKQDLAQTTADVQQRRSPSPEIFG